MLEATVAIGDSASAQHRQDGPPCQPRSTIRVTVRFAGPLGLIASWLRVHYLDPTRRDRWRTSITLIGITVALLASIGVVGLLATLRFNVLATTIEVADHPQSAASALAAVPESNGRTTVRESRTVAEGLAALGAHERRHWWRTFLIALGVPIIAFAITANLLGRRPVCVLYLVVLKPHEPFPTIDRDLSAAASTHIYAIRALGSDARRTYFRLLFDRRLRVSDLSEQLSTIDVTHAGARSWTTKQRHCEPYSYWALIRYALTQLLPRASSRLGDAAAYAFTLKMHMGMMTLYFWMTAAAILLPATGLVRSAEDTQFPVIMAGLGITWAVATLLVHSQKLRHLFEWERLTTDEPFRGCPIFQYTEPNSSKQPGTWEQLDYQSFSRPMRDFGLRYSSVINVTVAVLFTAYLALLQLIK